MALVCLCASLAAQGGRWSVGLDLWANAAPLWLSGSALAGVGALAAWRASARWRIAVAVASALGVVAAGALIAPEVSRPDPGFAPSAGPRLRIIQINIGGSGLARPEPAAAWLAAQHPDLVFVDDADARFISALRRAGFAWTRGTAWTGIASRRPLLRSKVVFSAHDWRTMPDMARARVSTAGGPAELIATHLVRPWPQGHAQQDDLASLRSLAGRYDRSRLVIAGDLNLTPWSFSLRRLDHSLGLTRRDRAAFSWPARLRGAVWPMPFMPLDHLYAGDGWRTVRVAVGPAVGATHYPLIVDLQPTR
jgi:endonuclease/exonuclease/phosphatase (EEP) superfamily protein YafD